MPEEETGCKIEVKIGKDGKPQFSFEGDCLKIEQALKHHAKIIQKEIEKTPHKGRVSAELEEGFEKDIGKQKVMIESALDLIREETQQYDRYGDPINAYAVSLEEFREKWLSFYGVKDVPNELLREFLSDFTHNINQTLDEYFEEISKEGKGKRAEEDLEM